MLDEEANIRGVELPPPHAPPPDLETTPPDALLREDDDHWAPEMKVNFYFAIGMLLFMTALAGVTAEWLVDSIDGMTESSGVSREFVGLILLPGELSHLPLMRWSLHRVGGAGGDPPPAHLDRKTLSSTLTDPLSPLSPFLRAVSSAKLVTGRCFMAGLMLVRIGPDPVPIATQPSTLSTSFL